MNIATTSYQQKQEIIDQIVDKYGVDNLFKAFDLITDPILLVDSSGKMIGANWAASSALQYTPEQLAGINISEIDKLRELPLTNSLQNSSIQDAPLFYEAAFRKKDHTLLHVEVSISPVTIAEEDFALVVARDISSRKQQDKQRMLSDSLARHDINTPISLVIGFSEILQSFDNLSSEQIAITQLIHNAGKQALDIIRFTHELGNLKDENYQIKNTPFSLKDTLRNVIVGLQNIMQDRKVGVSLDWQIANRIGELFIVTGEETLIHTMCNNLIKNALEAAPPSSIVTVTVQDKEDGWGIAIHNRGAVPDCMLDRVFERFATHGKEGGTGLGAYSAQLIANLHGGDIVCDSSELSGTTVSLEIPYNIPAPNGRTDQ
ncbi:PAS domain-containing sensor histidine kinase [Pseudodesulfovibrio sp. zrk46]|uniref:PAS domain-containing sensor histidine kinase n=1 Tax=Pseudodesulfovibrio sp. zrk46 TaxID=2725288 RepID=UPI0014496D41|nr:PAS domain-containing sensor histidine kinase [Pseudodesulfovibrio sp. zrk46]QJB55314.1 PAS domain-containing sensor histidine kinase [Pseudodesulfovibrio sp. zrk46]